jgi:hypothetical protein
MSTPLARIQSGIAMRTSPRGKPEEKDRRATAAVRQEVIARAMLFRIPGDSLGRDVKSATGMPT